METAKIRFEARIETLCGKKHRCEIMAKNELGAKLMATSICHRVLGVSTSRAIIFIINDMGRHIAVKNYGRKWDYI